MSPQLRQVLGSWEVNPRLPDTGFLSNVPIMTRMWTTDGRVCVCFHASSAGLTGSVRAEAEGASSCLERSKLI